MRALAIVLTLILAHAAHAQDFRDVIRQVDGAVGRVLAEHGRDVGTGSGFVVGRRSGALIFVTNYHVVQNARRLTVGFRNGAGVALYKGEIVGSSAERDFAVLRLLREGGASHRPAELIVSDREADKSEAVAAIGFPGVSDDLLGENFHPTYFDTTVTQGTVSKVFPGRWGPRFPPVEIVQHSAAINPGNSGGPLVNRCGVVVGVNTARPLNDENGTQWAGSSRALADWLEDVGVPYESSAAACTSDTGVQVRVEAGMASWRPSLVLIGGIAALALAAVGGAVWYQRREAPAGAASLVQNGAAAETVVVPPGHDGIEVAISGDGTPVRRTFTTSELRGGIVIGRSAEAAISLDGEGLSRRHARIALDGRTLTITDLGSTNGTRLDGKRLRPNKAAPLSAKSRVQIGHQTLTLRRLEG